MSARTEEVSTVGLGATSHDLLKRMKQDGHFEDMVDAYKFAVGLAVQRGLPPVRAPNRTTVFNVGTLDPDGDLRTLVMLFYPNQTESAYRLIEGLAEAGLEQLAVMTEAGHLPLSTLFAE